MAQTHILTYGHGDNMTESAQWDQLSEKQKSVLRLLNKIGVNVRLRTSFTASRKRSSKTLLITLVELQKF